MKNGRQTFRCAAVAVLIFAGCSSPQKNIAIIQMLDKSFNEHNHDAVVALFADNGVIRLTPPPPDGGVYEGTAGVSQFVSNLLPGFHVQSINFAQSGNKVTWMFTVHSDYFGQMGVNPVTGTGEAVIQNGKIVSFSPTFSSETVAKMVATGFLKAFDGGMPLEQMAGQFIGPEFRIHQPGLPSGDLEAYKKTGAMFRVAFPDLHHQIEAQIAEGDLVMTRLRFSGTNTGKMRGMPPSGKKIDVSGIMVNRVVNGKIVEAWVEFDQLTLLQQLGASTMRMSSVE